MVFKIVKDFITNLSGKNKKVACRKSMLPNVKYKSPNDLTPCSVLEAGGMKMPLVGLGTWQSHSECLQRATLFALSSGYRHIDTAYIYKNEKAIAKAFDLVFKCKSVQREHLFVSNKLPIYGMKPHLVQDYLYRSLNNLGLNYLDLYMIHFPVGVIHKQKKPDCQIPDENVCIQRVWQAMEDEVYKGYVKNIGVSNFNINQIERILCCARIPPSNLQIEMHLYCQQKELLAFCKSQNISVTAYAPLGSPGLGAYLSQPITSSSDSPPLPLQNPKVLEIASDKNKSAAQILLRHLLQLGVAVIPKSTDPERIYDNIKVFDFNLTDDEMNQLNRLDQGNDGRMFHANVWKGLENHTNFPFPDRKVKSFWNP